MQVSKVNDIKIYNLSAGKSLPQWLSQRRRRRLDQQNVDIRRRIQLIQDFDMPDISQSICISPDGMFAFAAGAYKPTVKCFDLCDLSLKFSRGVDSEVVKMLVLSNDYSKFVLLEEERYLELHVAYGRYFRFRIPTFGRDIAYTPESSDIYIVGSGSHIYRLSLEQGRFLEPLATQGTSLTCCEFNEAHRLFACGTTNGIVEMWDPRSPIRVGSVDFAMTISNRTDRPNNEPFGVSALKFQDALQLAVGSSQGQIALYDIRCSRPRLIKDHYSGLPIKKIDFSTMNDDLAFSLDARSLKIWNVNDGSPYTAIEPGIILNDLVVYPNTGLIFMAGDATKILQFFLPSIGPAPKWCSYLENITEELEEDNALLAFDDYKFVTLNELNDLDLSHLLGTNVLRAYMHGYFIDVRLYNKAKSLHAPAAFKEYKKKKVQDCLDSERKLLFDDVHQKKGAAISSDDNRFQQICEHPDFEIDQNSEEYKRLHSQPKRDSKKKTKAKR